jgi:septal ring factor EnvC (AmiA/AmiB activator)
MKRRTLLRTAQALTTREDLEKLEALKKEVSRLEKAVAHKDEELEKLQHNNDHLKKEIWRVRHELRFSSVRGR